MPRRTPPLPGLSVPSGEIQVETRTDQVRPEPMRLGAFLLFGGKREMAVCFYLSDLLERAGFDPKEVLLMRHPLSNPRVNKCYETGFLETYTRVQGVDFAKQYAKYKYWMVFIGNSGTSGLFKAMYKVIGFNPIHPKLMPPEYPFPAWFEQKDSNVYFDLMECPEFADLRDCLIIDWGKGCRTWKQGAFNPKEVLAIRPGRQIFFPGYEDLILPFDALSDIVSDGITYGEWHTALASVYGIYLITDMVSGKQYVGSAYGKKDGLLGRWKVYTKTHHGGNKGIKELLKEDPERYHPFQFSILQILPKNLSDDEVIQIENRYKDKLQTREFGLNDN